MCTNGCKMLILISPYSPWWMHQSSGRRFSLRNWRNNKREAPPSCGDSASTRSRCPCEDSRCRYSCTWPCSSCSSYSPSTDLLEIIPRYGYIIYLILHGMASFSVWDVNLSRSNSSDEDYHISSTNAQRSKLLSFAVYYCYYKISLTGDSYILIFQEF